jgi:hypothetical protein
MRREKVPPDLYLPAGRWVTAPAAHRRGAAAGAEQFSVPPAFSSERWRDLRDTGTFVIAERPAFSNRHDAAISAEIALWEVPIVEFT